MRISSKLSVAIEVLVVLDRQDYTEVEQVSEYSGFSVSYIEQVIPPLRVAGIMEGKKGPGGGYRLGRDPKAISIADVAQAVDGTTHMRKPHTDCIHRWLLKTLSYATLDDVLRGRDLSGFITVGVITQPETGVVRLRGGP